MSDVEDGVSGSCLCGGIRYRVRKFARPVTACHCTQCRKTSGHHVAATNALNDDIDMLADETLTWYRSSEGAERGFCNRCGGNAFWREVGSDTVAIMAGLLDAPTGLRLTAHIFAADAGDYYEIVDGLPAFPAYE